MSGEFYNPKYSHHPQDPQGHPSPLQLRVFVSENSHEDGDIIRRDGQQVNDVQGLSDKVTFILRDNEPDDALRREPANADSFNYPVKRKHTELFISIGTLKGHHSLQ